MKSGAMPTLVRAPSSDISHIFAGKVDEGFDRPLIQTVRGAGYTLRA